ncbi:MAG: NUDIX domain-containing protein [Acetobacteraceae bacterium]|nr:NUDIX domain-containing protein [Acetobacteraceae bacterium]
MTRQTSCGVVVTNGRMILLGHATLSPRWDIPKGLAEPDEPFIEAAIRELEEETGLTVVPEALCDLGVHRYRPGKDLALFAWARDVLPKPETLTCRSTFALANGRLVPEFDRFALFTWPEAATRVGRNMARVLDEVRPGLNSWARSADRDQGPDRGI